MNAKEPIKKHYPWIDLRRVHLGLYALTVPPIPFGFCHQS